MRSGGKKNFRSAAAALSSQNVEMGDLCLLPVPVVQVLILGRLPVRDLLRFAECSHKCYAWGRSDSAWYNKKKVLVEMLPDLHEIFDAPRAKVAKGDLGGSYRLSEERRPSKRAKFQFISPKGIWRVFTETIAPGAYTRELRHMNLLFLAALHLYLDSTMRIVKWRSYCKSFIIDIEVTTCDGATRPLLLSHYPHDFRTDWVERLHPTSWRGSKVWDTTAIWANFRRFLLE